MGWSTEGAWLQRKIAFWMAKGTDAEEGGVLQWYGGPREWGVPPSGWSLTSLTSL